LEWQHLIGYADTQREVVEKALESILENMDIDERRKFDIQYQVLEDKTIKSMKNK
jgi:BMFP domain-containing protein YqiC